MSANYFDWRAGLAGAKPPEKQPKFVPIAHMRTTTLRVLAALLAQPNKRACEYAAMVGVPTRTASSILRECKVTGRTFTFRGPKDNRQDAPVYLWRLTEPGAVEVEGQVSMMRDALALGAVPAAAVAPPSASPYTSDLNSILNEN